MDDETNCTAMTIAGFAITGRREAIQPFGGWIGL